MQNILIYEHHRGKLEPFLARSSIRIVAFPQYYNDELFKIVCRNNFHGMFDGFR